MNKNIKNQNIYYDNIEKYFDKMEKKEIPSCPCNNTGYIDIENKIINNYKSNKSDKSDKLKSNKLKKKIKTTGVNNFFSNLFKNKIDSTNEKNNLLKKSKKKSNNIKKNNIIIMLILIQIYAYIKYYKK